MEAQQVVSSNGNILNGLLYFNPTIFGDSRGFFQESWNQRNWEKILKSNGQTPKDFVQDNHSRSSKGTIRGLHFQKAPYAQGKLVRCINGRIFDVAVDLRKDSTTFGQWAGIELSSENHIQFWIPEGFAHGFLALSNIAEVFYKVTDYWNKQSEISLIWNDKNIRIDWPLDLLDSKAVKLSHKDKNACFLVQIRDKDLF